MTWELGWAGSLWVVLVDRRARRVGTRVVVSEDTKLPIRVRMSWSVEANKTGMNEEVQSFVPRALAFVVVQVELPLAGKDVKLVVQGMVELSLEETLAEA